MHPLLGGVLGALGAYFTSSFGLRFLNLFSIGFFSISEGFWEAKVVQKSRYLLFHQLGSPLWGLKGFFLRWTVGCSSQASWVPPQPPGWFPRHRAAVPLEVETKVPLKRLKNKFPFNKLS